MKWLVLVFRDKDWHILTVNGVAKEFDTEPQAEQFVRDYNRTDEWGRAIRDGWQVVKAEGNCAALDAPKAQ